jgi:hypothetical protein
MQAKGCHGFGPEAGPVDLSWLPVLPWVPPSLQQPGGVSLPVLVAQPSPVPVVVQQPSPVSVVVQQPSPMLELGTILKGSE